MPTREEYRQILIQELDKKSEKTGDGNSCTESVTDYGKVRKRD